jgi:hypothetical protein
VSLATIPSGFESSNLGARPGIPFAVTLLFWSTSSGSASVLVPTPF